MMYAVRAGRRVNRRGPKTPRASPAGSREEIEQRATSAEVAAELRVSERSVRRWRQPWQAVGVAELASRGQAARCLLDEAQLAELETVLEAKPLPAGWTDQRWTLARVRDLVAGKFSCSTPCRNLLPAAPPRLVRARWAPAAPSSAATTPSRFGTRRPGRRRKDGSGLLRLDRLRGRDRPVAEAAAIQDLGAARDHSPHPRQRCRHRARLGRAPGLLPVRRAEPPDVPAAPVPLAQGLDQGVHLDGVPGPADRRALPAARRSHRAGL